MLKKWFLTTTLRKTKAVHVSAKYKKDVFELFFFRRAGYLRRNNQTQNVTEACKDLVSSNPRPPSFLRILDLQMEA
jgi:hypothetical protein